MWRYILAAAITAVILFAIYGPRSGQASPSTFEWAGAVPAQGWVNVRNNNGAIRIEEGSGEEIEVRANIRGGRRSRNVGVTVNEQDGILYLCPTVADRGRCGPGGFSTGAPRGLSRLFRGRSQAHVDFVIRVPDGVHADASTSNGNLTISGLHGETKARTVNGRIELNDVFGAVTARSTNGSIRARLDSLPASVPLSFRTTNGSITAELPETLSADVELATTNGRINSGFPVSMGTEMSSRRFRGRIGDGGRELIMRTTNGSITLRPIEGGEAQAAGGRGRLEVNVGGVSVSIDTAGIAAAAEAQALEEIQNNVQVRVNRGTTTKVRAGEVEVTP